AGLALLQRAGTAVFPRRQRRHRGRGRRRDRRRHRPRGCARLAALRSRATIGRRPQFGATRDHASGPQPLASTGIASRHRRVVLVHAVGLRDDRAAPLQCPPREVVALQHPGELHLL
ncbi:MAG: hypothetical protein ACK55I_00125, partial [bacterium]